MIVGEVELVKGNATNAGCSLGKLRSRVGAEKAKTMRGTLGDRVETTKDIGIATPGSQKENAQIAEMNRGWSQLVGRHRPGNLPRIKGMQVTSNICRCQRPARSYGNERADLRMRIEAAIAPTSAACAQPYVRVRASNSLA